MKVRRLLPVLAVSLLSAGGLHAQVTNYKSGIDVTWGGTAGTDYYEEYFYHDRLVDDHKVVYLRSTTTIAMAHNDRNTVNYHSQDGGRMVVGINGRDNTASSGDEGVIRYKIDRDRQDYWKWAQNFAQTDTARRLPAYSAPFALASQTFETGVNVVGTTGWNVGASPTSTQFADRSATYYRGIQDSVGDEWHVLAYADDDESHLRQRSVDTGLFVDQAFYASDGKTVLLVVNPKTPCLSVTATGTGQFYTTPPKAYWTPKIVDQTTYLAPGTSGTVSIELRDIYGNNVFYRINSNSGSFTNANASTVTLTDASFSDGTNTLDYYYAGKEAFVKRRTIVKNPGFPSASEAHGNYLWVDTAGYNKMLTRIARAPYASTYTNYRNRNDFSGQLAWDNNAGRGLRYSPANGGDYTLKNALVAKVEGFNFVRSGGSKSHGRYAKEMLLDGPRSIDPIGFEMNHSSEAIPNRELHYRGYYDSNPVLEGIFAYDIMIANFKSTQATGGITAIEDYYIRDRFAGFAFEAMQWSGGMTGLDAPGMWGGARMMTASIIAMIMREYSTPYFGTSGFGTVQTTYPLCPYQTDQLTWKAAMFDGTATKTAYPNLKWYTGISDNGTSSLFFGPSEALAEGHWRDKISYFSFGLMGKPLCIWANMAYLWGVAPSSPNYPKKDPRFELAVAFASTNPGLLGGQADSGDTGAPGERFHMLTLLNSRWPTVASNNLAYVQGLRVSNPSDENADTKAMQDAGVFAFVWYDDQAVAPTSPSNLRSP